VHQAENKVVALRDYRRARNLCQYCAEKWVHGHKCTSTVQLQAVQELWELLSNDYENDGCSLHSEGEAQVHMIFSQEAVSTVTSSKTLKFKGSLQGHYVLILIDSGSSHSFVNATLAGDFSQVSPLQKLLSV
jgi:hypothetical protein